MQPECSVRCDKYPRVTLFSKTYRKEQQSRGAVNPSTSSSSSSPVHSADQSSSRGDVSLYLPHRPDHCIILDSDHLLGSPLFQRPLILQPQPQPLAHRRGVRCVPCLSPEDRVETNKRVMIRINDCMHLHSLIHYLRLIISQCCGSLVCTS